MVLLAIDRDQRDQRIVPPVLILAFVLSFATAAAGVRSGTMKAYNEAKGFGPLAAGVVVSAR